MDGNGWWLVVLDLPMGREGWVFERRGSACVRKLHVAARAFRTLAPLLPEALQIERSRASAALCNVVAQLEWV